MVFGWLTDPMARVFGRGAARRPDNDVAFSMAVVALGAKLTIADGHTSFQEVEAFREVFRAPPHAERQVARVFKLARQSTRGFESYAKRIARRWKHTPEVLENVLDGLFYIAAADGHVAEEEVEYLRAVADAFGIEARCFRRLLHQWSPDHQDPYAILGVSPEASAAEIRRAYRELAIAHHPDRFAARGMPPAAEALANAKMAAINAAYAEITEKSGGHAAVHS